MIGLLALAGTVWLAPAVPSHPNGTIDLDAWQGRRVERIELRGNRVTREEVILRELRTRPGERFDADTVRGDLQRLENLEIFSEVRAEPVAAGKEALVLGFLFKEGPGLLPFPIIALTQENDVAFGVGVGTNNLGGRNISLGARAQWGGSTEYSAGFAWPWISGNHLAFAVRGIHLEREDHANHFNEKSDELTPRLGSYLGEHGRVEGRFSLFRMRSDTPGKTLDPDDEDLLVRAGLSIGLDTRDSWPYPRHGWQNELLVWRTGGALGGDGDFWSADLDVRRFFATGSRQRLMLSGLGSMQTGDVGVDLPVYLTYAIGGSNTVRGHDPRADDRPQGKNQLIGTGEYSVLISPLRRRDFWKLSFRLGLELALFGDLGLAWTRSSEFAWSNTRWGAGGGLRLLVPGAEMIRVDVGWSPDEGVNVHFASGSKPAAQRRRVR